MFCFPDALNSMGVSWDIINDDGISIGLNQHLYSHLNLIYSQYFLQNGHYAPKRDKQLSRSTQSASVSVQSTS